MNMETVSNTSIPRAMPPSRQENRLHEIIARLMSLTFHLGHESFTFRDFLLDNDLKTRVIKEISYQSKINLLNGSKQAILGVKYAASKVTPREIYRRRKLVVNLTVIGHLTTSISKVVKILMIQSDIKIKEINSIVKFSKKAVYFRNGDWGVNLRSIASDPETFHKLLKLIYNTLYILARTVEMGSENSLIKAGFAAIDRTTDFDIFIQATAPFVDYLTIPMNPIKLMSKTSGLYIAYRDWSKIEFDDLPEDKRIKRLELGKSVLDTSLIGLRVLLVTAGLSAAAQGVITATALLSMAHATMAIATYVQKKNAKIAKSSLNTYDPFAIPG